MTSFSTSIFGPVAILLGMLLTMGTAITTADITTTSPPEKTQDLIQFLLAEIEILKGEFGEQGDICKSKVALVKNNMNIPELKEEDRCSPTEFDKDTCLNRISTGLLEFQVYLEYMYKNFNDKENSKTLPIGTKALFNILHKKVSCPCEIVGPESAVTESMREKLHSLFGWERRTAVRLILCGLETFLQDTLNVVRSM